MASRTRKRITLFALASGLAVVFFVVTVGLWSAVRPLGDVLVALIVATAICVAGLSGYWQDTPELSVVTTLLVAGGHVLGEHIRTRQAIRLPPVQSRYYVLVVGVAVTLGLSAYYLGRFVADQTASRV